MAEQRPRVGLSHPTVIPDEPAPEHERQAGTAATSIGVDHPTVVPRNE